MIRKKTVLIESESNETYRKMLSLTGAKGLKKESLYLLSGKDLIQEFLSKKENSDRIAYEVLTADHHPISEAPCTQLSQKLFDSLDVLGTHHNLLVVQQPTIFDIELSREPEGLEVFLPLGDPSNLGAALRSCEAFGASKVVLLSESAHPFLPKSVKASAGSAFRVPLWRGPSLKDLKSQKHSVALDGSGKSLTQWHWPKNVRLILGEEGPGLPTGWQTPTIKIPTAGVESLNAVVALSVALFHYRQRNS